jgi:hypothetical protein
MCVGNGHLLRVGLFIIVRRYIYGRLRTPILTISDARHRRCGNGLMEGGLACQPVRATLQ